jgi:hypothetical protein
MMWHIYCGKLYSFEVQFPGKPRKLQLMWLIMNNHIFFSITGLLV